MPYENAVDKWLREFKQNKNTVNWNPTSQYAGSVTRDGITETNIGPNTKQPVRKNIMDEEFTMPTTSLQMPSGGFMSNANQPLDWRRIARMTNNQDDNYFGNLGGIPYNNPEFEWGLNMPTFNLVKGGLDTLGGLTNTWLNFRKFGLLEDQAKYEMDMGDKKYANDLILGNNQIADANFGIRERNLFKEKTMKPGGYILQDELKTIG